MSGRPDETRDTAFEREFVAQLPVVRAYACKLARGSHAEDLAQGAMLKAWEARDSYTKGTNLRGWLLTILHNHFCSEARRRRRTQSMDPEIIEKTLVSHEDPSSHLDFIDVIDAIDQLPPEQREALMLAGPEGLTYEEMARRCGCVMGTVKSRLSRARANLAAALEQRGESQKTTRRRNPRRAAAPLPEISRLPPAHRPRVP